MSTAWRLRANTQVITACTTTQVDACRLLLTNYSLGHGSVSRPTESSAMPQSRLCCGVWLRLNGNEGGRRGFSIVSDWQTTGQFAARWRTSALQPMFSSSGRSLPGPWENKGVRLHLFSVPVPGGIKGEDITSCPAWLGPTHLRGPFSPRSLRALFTHPADMACGTVVA